MKEKIKFLSDYIILVLYAICLYILWNLCEYGGKRYWLSLMAPFALLLIILIVIRLIVRHKGYRASYFKIRLVLFIAVSLIFGGMIVHTAIPYNGALSWKIADLLNHQKITLTHNNIYKDGVNGVIDDVRTKISLPKKLYISDNFRIEFTEDGTITNIDVMLYGENDKGQLKGFLLSYDYEKAKKMDVWLNDGPGLSINPDKLLDPFYTILKQAPYQDQVRRWNLRKLNQTYTFLYSGKTKVNSEMGLYILHGDEHDGEQYDSELVTPKLLKGGAISGYEASLYERDNKEVAPIRYLVNPQYVSPETLANEHNSEVIEKVKNTKNWFTDDANGTVYNFAPNDKNVGYRLVVADAAAGSRFYRLEKTTDGGKKWQTVNKNPFIDKAGVAEGIIFFSNNFGFIGIQGASGQYSQLYMTKDGGVNFRQLILPMDKVTDIPKEGKENGLKLDDYQYLSMPEYKENKLFITVTSGVEESNGIEFYSEDYGENWNVLKR